MQYKTPLFVGLVASTVVMTTITGCNKKEQPVTMAPPSGGGVPQTAPVTQAPPVANALASNPVPPAPGGNAAEGSVYDWRDVPANQDVPIVRGSFDQGGYQLYAASGETIVVPFENQNMYVMKFGRSDGNDMYFKNEDGKAPLLFIPRNGYLTNASAQGAKWYPFSKDFEYSRPVYMGIAPTWNDYVGMGWYPGMLYYGGYWGYRPWVPGLFYTPMVGLNINIGGRPYYGWNSYRSYYTVNTTGRSSWGSSYNYSSVGRRSPGTGSFGRSASSTGSFGRGGTGTASTARNSTGSFGSNNRTSATRSGPSSFGTASNSASRTGTGTGSFGSNRSSSGASSSASSSGFSSNNRTRSSFGSGTTSGFSGATGRSSSSSGSSSSFGRSSSGSGSSSSFGRSSSSSSGRSSSSSSFGGGGRRRR
jgi:hypothetical protein